MKVSIAIDGSAWNYLFEKAIDLTAELPPDTFNVFIPREVEVELGATPDIGKDGQSKVALRRYVWASIESRQVQTSATFGFAEAGGAFGLHRYAGFGGGTFASDEERTYYADTGTQRYLVGRSQRPSGLTQYEADAALAASSSHSVVLTNDKKNGPIRDARAQGGKVIYLKDFDAQSLPLAAYILSFR
ncbi:hypothetical protein [Labrys monachus]|uniref:PIN domain-containing protein n=1 Tax=Labrys monachus TaxID=217067 RepID=A0ABU0F9S6_9HYPH|nr:hypothetical protein [Labrys monachus]MDQ0390810.1 hypothetical protein [Labrys monachus]